MNDTTGNKLFTAYHTRPANAKEFGNFRKKFTNRLLQILKLLLGCRAAVQAEIPGGAGGVPAEQAGALRIAYEPVWAIGTSGVPAAREYAEEKHAVIRRTLAELYGESCAADIPLLYGGSVNRTNAVELIQTPNIDGLFIGRSAWAAEEFSAIIQDILAL